MVKRKYSLYMTEAHLENTASTHVAYIHDTKIGRLPIVSIHYLLLPEFIASHVHDLSSFLVGSFSQIFLLLSYTGLFGKI